MRTISHRSLLSLSLATVALSLGCAEGTRKALRSERAPCPLHQTRCGDRCVSLASNPAHCGSCADTCPSPEYACVDGACVVRTEGLSITDPRKRDVYNGRRGERFNGKWRFARGDVAEAQERDFDDSSWRTVDLPHDYGIELAFDAASPAGRGGGYLDGGIAWYRKSFLLPAELAQRRLSIHFDGVYMDSTVWLNGTLLGGRPYGYSSFGFELTKALNFGTTPNVIAVRVNHQQPSSRWYSGSGIYRNVWLTLLHPVHVVDSGVFIRFGPFTKGAMQGSAVPPTATAAVSTEVLNDSNEARVVSVTATLRDAEGAKVAGGSSDSVELAGHAQQGFEQQLEVPSPHLWSPSSPYLYELEVEVTVAGAVVDRYRTSAGIRYLHFDPNGGFYLNGQRLEIFGAALHDDLGALGVAFNYRAMERRVELLKSMGANALRTAHNPPAPELLEICDRLGMLVMEEAFDCWETAKSTYDYARFFDEWAELDLKDMVRRDRNHPSVFLWSVGNEIASPTLDTAAKLKQWVLEEDDTRPATWARDSMQAPEYQQITDQVFDLAGFNYPSPELYDSLHGAYPAWSCFGSEVMSGRMSRGIFVFPAAQRNLKTFPDWGSSYDNCTSRQAMGHDEDCQVYEDRPYLFGRFIWSGFDYLGEMDWPLKSNNDGKIDTAGFPKEAYYIYQSRLTQEPMVHLLPHWNWAPGGSYYYTDPNSGDVVMPLSSGTIPERFPVTVVAYTNAEEVELLLNGGSLGSQRCVPGLSGRCQWEVPWEPGTLTALARRAGEVVARDEVTTAGAPAVVALASDRSEIAFDGEDLAFVTAQIQDTAGIPVPTAQDRVEFSVEGPGEIIAVDNGDPSDTDEPYRATARRAFAGKCLAIVKATGAGELVVTATAGGMSGGSVTLRATKRD